MKQDWIERQEAMTRLTMLGVDVKNFLELGDISTEELIKLSVMLGITLAKYEYEKELEILGVKPKQ